MPRGNVEENEKLAAEAVVALAWRQGRLGATEPVTGYPGDDALTALIRAKFATSRSDSSLFASFLLAPDDEIAQSKMRFALERSAGDDPEFRDRLAQAMEPLHSNDLQESDSGGGTSNTTAIVNSTIRGRGHNLGILTKNNRKNISLGLGGLAALALIGGGAYALSPEQAHLHPAVAHSATSPTDPRSGAAIPVGAATLPDGQYIYMGSMPHPGDSPPYDLFMMRWTMRDGYGNGACVIAESDVNTSGVLNGVLVVQGTVGSLTATLTPPIGQTITEPITLSGNTLTFPMPGGDNGMTTITLHRGTIAEWDNSLAAYKKVASA